MAAPVGYMGLSPEFIQANEALGFDPYEAAGWNRLDQNFLKTDPTTGQKYAPQKFEHTNFPNGGLLGDAGKVAGIFAGLIGGGGLLSGFGGFGAGAEAAALTGSGGFGAGGFGSSFLAPAGGAAAAGSSALDLGDWQDWSNWGSSQGSELPGVDDWSTWNPQTTPNGTGWDVYGNGDMGYGTQGTTDPFSGGMPPSGSGIPTDLWSKITGALQNGANPSSLAKLFGATTSDGSYQFPFGKVLGSLLESYGQKQYSNDLQGYLNKSLDYADPFHNERPGYQQQFKQLTQNPSNFFNDPAIKSAIDFEDQATSRKLASQGYNMSGNFANDVAQTRMREAFKQYMPYSDMIGTAAGYKFGPGASGTIAANGGTAIANSNQSALAGLGSAFNSASNGAQPNYLEQIMGAGKNSDLWTALTQGGTA